MLLSLSWASVANTAPDPTQTLWRFHIPRSSGQDRFLRKSSDRDRTCVFLVARFDTCAHCIACKKKYATTKKTKIRKCGSDADDPSRTVLKKLRMTIRNNSELANTFHPSLPFHSPQFEKKTYLKSSYGSFCAGSRLFGLASKSWMPIRIYGTYVGTGRRARRRYR